MNQHASSLALFMCMALAMGCVDYRQPTVALNLVSATATRSPVNVKTTVGWVRTNLVYIDTEVEVRNRSGSQLTVMSSTESPLNWIEVVVMDATGVELARINHGFHKSPMYIPARPSTLPGGSSTNRVGFPMLPIPQGLKTVWIALSGQLEAEGFTTSVTSNVVKVPIEERFR